MVTIHTDPPGADVYLRGGMPGNEKWIGKSGTAIAFEKGPNFQGAWEVALRHPDQEHQEKLERIVPGNERWPQQGEIVLPAKDLWVATKDFIRRHPKGGAGLLVVLGGLVVAVLYHRSKNKVFLDQEKAQATLNERLIAAGGVLQSGVNQFPTIGDYYLLDSIDKGGMGQVYKAVSKQDAESGAPIAPDKVVAIKKILPQAIEEFKELVRQEQEDAAKYGGAPQVLIDPQARFLREARNALLVKHPNCVKTFDFQIVEPDPFMVMEYLPGETLQHEILRRKKSSNPWTFAEAFQIFKPLCDAIQYAHDLKIIHRDLKPDNIKLIDHKTPKVIDFGLARRVGAFETTIQSAKGDIRGYRSYLAPEVFGLGGSQGIVNDNFGRDQFALGVIFYEMLTMEIRFPEPRYEHLDPMRKQNEPDHAQLPHLPLELVDAIAKMYALREKDRYESVQEACKTIEDIAAQHSLL